MISTEHHGWGVAHLVAWVLGLAAAASLVVPALIERDQLRSEVETRWTEHAYALGYTVNATALAEQTRAMQSMHEQLATRLPDDIDAESLRGQMRAEAAAAGLSIDSLEIEPRQLREFYGQRAVRLVARADAPAVHAMLSQILHTAPLRRAESFSLERTQDDSVPVLRFELVLHAYDNKAP